MSAALLAFPAALLLTRLYLPLARRWQQLDAPNARSAHRRPIASSGGLPLLLALLFGLAAAQLLGAADFGRREVLALLLALLLCAAGAADDRRPLPVALRLPLFLLLAAVAAGLYAPPAGAATLPAFALLTLALAWLINLYNFMDGIDGLAALQCSVVAAALGGCGWLGEASAAYVAAALATAAVYGAFLRFNWPPARLFMGDAGSLSAGFLLGWLGLWGCSAGFVPASLWLLLMSPFLVDTGYTLLARLLRGERITEAHSQHVYQRLARRWRSHRRVDLALLLLQALWLLPLAWLQLRAGLPGAAALGLALAPQLAGLLLVARRGSLQ